MNTNRLVLSGKIYNKPVRNLSPAGIPHCYFVLEHRSQQQEADLKRKVWCRIAIIISGQKLQDLIDSITVNCQITVIGFISSHHGSNGLSKLALHAEQIKLINSGE